MPQDEHARTRENREDQHPQAVFPCRHCGADTDEDVVKAAFWGSRGLLAMEDIPARVCRGCGEQFYDEETTRKMEKVITDPALKAGREILVPVFSLTEVEVAQRETDPCDGTGD